MPAFRWKQQQWPPKEEIRGLEYRKVKTLAALTNLSHWEKVSSSQRWRWANMHPKAKLEQHSTTAVKSGRRIPVVSEEACWWWGCFRAKSYQRSQWRIWKLKPKQSSKNFLTCAHSAEMLWFPLSWHSTTASAASKPPPPEKGRQKKLLWNVVTFCWCRWSCRRWSLPVFSCFWRGHLKVFPHPAS